jgi:hypothetical protein
MVAMLKADDQKFTFPPQKLRLTKFLKLSLSIQLNSREAYDYNP